MARRRTGCLTLLLVLAIIAIAVGLILPRLVVPPVVRAQLSKLFNNEVKIGSVKFSWAGSIRLAGITVSRPDGSVAAQIDKARVKLSLISRQIREVTAQDITLSLRPEDLRVERREGPHPALEFPIRLSNINATLELPGTPALVLSDGVLLLRPKTGGAVEIEGSGAFAPGRFSVSGVLGGRWLDNRLSFSVPAFNMSPETANLLPAKLASFWLEHQPRGKIALAADVAWAAARESSAPPDSLDFLLSQFEIDWRLNLDNASLFAPRLKEPLVDINAVVQGTNREFQLINGNALYRNIRLEASGYGRLDEKKLTVQIQGGARDIEPYDELIGLFPKRTSNVIRSLHMSARADAAIEMALAVPLDGQTPELSFLKVDLNVRGASVQVKWFPYRVSNIIGNLSITQHDLTITNPLSGSHGSGTVQMSGTIRFTDKGAATNMRIDFSRITPDADLVHAIEAVEPGAAETSKRFEITRGTFGGSFTWRGDFAADEPDWAVVASLESITGKYLDLPYEISNLTGEFEINGQGISFKNLRGWHGNGQIEMNGLIGGDRQSVEIHGRDIRLDEDLRAALPKESRETWELLQPAGLADMDVLLTTPVVPGVPNDMRLRVTLKDAALRIPIGESALPMRRISMRFEQEGDVVRITSMSGACLGGSIVGEGSLIRAGSNWKIEASITGENLLLSELVGALPPEKAARLERLDIDGRLDVNKLKLDLTRGTDGRVSVEYDAAVTLGNAHLEMPTVVPEGASKNEKPLRLSDINGRLTLRHSILTGTEGTLSFDRMRILNAMVTNIAGDIRSVGPTFSIPNFRGEIFGGRIDGAVEGARDLNYFHADAWVFGVDVARLTRELALTDERVWGDLRGDIHLNGRNVGGGWRLTGAGAANIDRANLGSTTLVKSLINYRAFFADVRDTTIEGVVLEFKVEPRQLIIDRLLLKGPLVSARGVGTVSTDDLGIDLYFYRRQRKGLLPNLPLIDIVGRGMSWVVDKIQNQLVVVHLTGTLTEPVVRPAVLKDLNEQFRRFVLFNIWEEEKSPAQTPEEE